MILYFFVSIRLMILQYVYINYMILKGIDVELSLKLIQFLFYASTALYCQTLKLRILRNIWTKRKVIYFYFDIYAKFAKNSARMSKSLFNSTKIIEMPFFSPGVYQIGLQEPSTVFTLTIDLKLYIPFL